MLKKAVYKLKTDEDFKRLIPPLSEEEYEQLAENIILNGCSNALVVWGKTIIDGHNRYEICSRHHIPFAIENITLGNRDEAVSLICANQLGRRNISDETRRYLIGKRYETEKRINVQRNASGTNQYENNDDTKSKFEEKERTKVRLGREYHVGNTTIMRYGEYASALDIIAKAAPEFHEMIMSGKLKVMQSSVKRIARLSPPEIRSVGADLIENPNAYVGYTDERGALRKNTPNKTLLAQMQIGAIKETPEYDPDAEIQSLVFTIPSWVSSINRVRMTAKFSEISDKARKRIEAELDELGAAIGTILEAIRENE